MGSVRQRISYVAARTLRGLSSTLGKVLGRFLRRVGLHQRLLAWHRRALVRLNNASVEERVRRRIEKPSDSPRIRALEAVLVDAFRRLGDTGDYLEFGVYYGQTLACAYRAASRLALNEMRFIGFDSFKGLPPTASTEAGPWLASQYRSDAEVAATYLDGRGVDPERCHLVEGWFSETLRPETAEALGLQRASVVMFDCDIYSSTREALEFTAPLVGEEAVFLFDDWKAKGVAEQDGQQRAFHEFLDENSHISSEYLGDYSRDSAVFLVQQSGLTRFASGSDERDV